MKVTVYKLKQFKADSDSDQLVAAEFCKEALTEVKQRCGVIEKLSSINHKVSK
ncbi:MAG: hypothetical protein Q7K26_06645 [bacterium]|nr:hypothetical protein [bacterium]